MHHFLWLEAFMQAKVDSTIVDQKLNATAQKELDAALSWYQDHLVEEDLRTSDYMSHFKVWITETGEMREKIPEEFADHVKTLKAFDDTYKTHFWPKHKEVCERVLEENLPLLRATEEKYVEAITTLTRQFWQGEPVHIDITYVAKATTWNLRNRPYTSIFPTHVVMNAVGENEVKGNWLELLYHESAHPLILSSSYFVGGTLKDLAEVENIELPRQLGHSYLFYFTGEITKQLLKEQGIDYPETYMQRNGVFSSYYALLEKHLTPYINREVTLIKATQNFLADFNQK